VKILYVAKHGSGDNDDEGGVAHALRQLGHQVECVQELRRHRPGMKVIDETFQTDADFCLFHKWAVISEIDSLKIPRVFWYFDLVDSEDPSLKRRSGVRVQWFGDVLPHCLLGFCTDGDWVAKDRTGKLVHLMQGMDERVAGYGKPIRGYAPILFTGMINHGRSRANHIAHLQERYGEDFRILGAGGASGRIHGRPLANIFASCRVVVAPDGPQSARYWSNRVYIVTGLGGLLLHPYTDGLAQQYTPSVDLLYYRTWEELDERIDCLLRPESDNFVQKMREAGHNKTMKCHLYRHRCAQLIDAVKERL
jgi:hypothetical protein